MYQMQKNSLLSANFFGLVGMNPDVITGIYSKIGANVTYYADPSKVSKDHDAYIALFFYPVGAHYVAAEYNKATHKFEVYNLDTSKKKNELNELSSKIYLGTFGWTVWGIDAPKQTIAGKSGGHSIGGKSRIMAHETM